MWICFYVLDLVLFECHALAPAPTNQNGAFHLPYQTCLLPSSSGANRRDQEGRLCRWKAAIQFIATDFNQKYKLTPEPALDDADVLSPDGLSAMFVRVDTGLIPSLNDVQNVLAQILLIPQVPESVRSTFRIAKRLYLFGRFEYGFYTVSQHYAFLAIEAAILCRWTASLPNPVTVEGNGFKQQKLSPSHGELAELWMHIGRKLIVDNLPFPNSPTRVLRRETGYRRRHRLPGATGTFQKPAGNVRRKRLIPRRRNRPVSPFQKRVLLGEDGSQVGTNTNGEEP
jgi:hypothetical protein